MKTTASNSDTRPVYRQAFGLIRSLALVAIILTSILSASAEEMSSAEGIVVLSAIHKNSATHGAPKSVLTAYEDGINKLKGVGSLTSQDVLVLRHDLEEARSKDKDSAVKAIALALGKSELAKSSVELTPSRKLASAEQMGYIPSLTAKSVVLTEKEAKHVIYLLKHQAEGKNVVANDGKSDAEQAENMETLRKAQLAAAAVIADPDAEVDGDTIVFTKALLNAAGRARKEATTLPDDVATTAIEVAKAFEAGAAAFEDNLTINDSQVSALPKRRKLGGVYTTSSQSAVSSTPATPPVSIESKPAKPASSVPVPKVTPPAPARPVAPQYVAPPAPAQPTNAPLVPSGPMSV